MGSSYSTFTNCENQIIKESNDINFDVKNTDRVEQMKKIQKEGLELFEKKNQDYGDSFATYGTIGVLVRMGDKISRFQSISNRGIKLIDTESLRDTLIDLHNYSAMAIMLLDEKPKPDIKPPPPSRSESPLLYTMINKTII
jgi:hypothetical protein